MVIIEIVRFAGALCFVAVVGFWLARHKEELLKLSPRRAWREAKRMGRREWVRLLAYSAAFIGVALLVIPLVAGWLVSTGAPLTSEEHPVVQTASISLPLAFLLMGVLPVFEEWLWRGIVLERLRKRIPVLNAVLISAFGFGLFHLLNAGTYLWGFIPPVVAGFIFSIAYLMDGLKCASLTHIGYNETALVLAFLL